MGNFADYFNWKQATKIKGGQLYYLLVNLITSFWGHMITFTKEPSLNNSKLRVCVLKGGGAYKKNSAIRCYWRN